MYTDYWYDNVVQRVSSKAITEYLSARHRGPERTVTTFAPINEASPDQLTFCKREYDEYIKETRADVIITHFDISCDSEKTLIIVEDPKSAFVEVVHEFFIEYREFQIHRTAKISSSANIGDNCLIGPFVVIGPDVQIGDNCIIGPGTTIGQPGFGYQHTNNDRTINVPHSGEVIIENDVHLGANCTIDRATFDITRISSGSKIHHLVHVGHNTHIGRHNLINRGSSLSGSVSTGEAVRIHPHAVVGSHTDIGDFATIGANSTVLDDVPADVTVVGNPAQPIE